MKIYIKKNHLIYVYISFFLILIAGLRLLGWANDTENYYEMVVYHDEFRLATKEILFRIIIFFNMIIFSTNFTSFLLFFAFFGVSLKLIAFSKYSPIPALSIVLYFLSYFWLHEYIQIRAGVATAIFLFAIIDLVNNNFKAYIFKAIIAIMFHWSSILLLPLYFIIKYMSIRIFMILPFVGMLIYLSGFNIEILIQFILNLFNIDTTLYKMYAGYKNTINVFNIISISYIILFLFITSIIINKKKLFSTYEIILYKIFSFSIFIFFFVATLNSPVVAFRLIEYFNIVLLIFLPFIVLKFKQKYLISSLFIGYYGMYTYFLFSKVIEFV